MIAIYLPVIVFLIVIVMLQKQINHCRKLYRYLYTDKKASNVKMGKPDYFAFYG